MEEHKMPCGHPSDVDDACSACMDEAIDLLKQFVAIEKAYCLMLDWDKTEACIKAEEFLATR
jgi:hypothetical protein